MSRTHLYDMMWVIGENSECVPSFHVHSTLSLYAPAIAYGFIMRTGCLWLKASDELYRPAICRATRSGPNFVWPTTM